MKKVFLPILTAALVGISHGQLIYENQFETLEDMPTVRFGNPEISELTISSGNSLEFEGYLSYEQIEIPLEYSSNELYIAYTVMTENLAGSDYSFTTIMDTPSVRNFSFHGGLGRAYRFPGYGDFFYFEDNVVYRVEHLIDFPGNTWEILVNGVSLGITTFDASMVNKIRFNMSPWTGAADSDDPSVKAYLDDVIISDAKPSELPPVANAGDDRIEYDSFSLDGSASFDPDGEIIEYLWNLTPWNQEASILLAEGVNPSFEDVPTGFYSVYLEVIDSQGLSTITEIALAVKGPRPVANYSTETGILEIPHLVVDGNDSEVSSLKMLKKRKKSEPFDHRAYRVQEVSVSE